MTLVLESQMPSITDAEISEELELMGVRHNGIYWHARSILINSSDECSDIFPGAYHIDDLLPLVPEYIEDDKRHRCYRFSLEIQDEEYSLDLKSVTRPRTYHVGYKWYKDDQIDEVFGGSSTKLADALGKLVTDLIRYRYIKLPPLEINDEKLL